MNLNDYIALSSERPNRAVLQGLGASEELIEYLMETPNNTNWNMVGSLNQKENKERTLIFERLIEFHDSGYGFSLENIDNLNIPDTEYLIVTLSNSSSSPKEYVLPKTTIMDSIIAYGEANDTGPIFTNYPCLITPIYEGVNYSTLYISTSGFWRVKIEIEK